MALVPYHEVEDSVLGDETMVDAGNPESGTAQSSTTQSWAPSTGVLAKEGTTVPKVAGASRRMSDEDVDDDENGSDWVPDKDGTPDVQEVVAPRSTRRRRKKGVAADDVVDLTVEDAPVKKNKKKTSSGRGRKRRADDEEDAEAASKKVQTGPATTNAVLDRIVGFSSLNAKVQLTLANKNQEAAQLRIQAATLSIQIADRAMAIAAQVGRSHDAAYILALLRALCANAIPPETENNIPLPLPTADNTEALLPVFDLPLPSIDIQELRAQPPPTAQPFPPVDVHGVRAQPVPDWQMDGQLGDFLRLPDPAAQPPAPEPFGVEFTPQTLDEIFGSGFAQQMPASSSVGPASLSAPVPGAYPFHHAQPAAQPQHHAGSNTIVNHPYYDALTYGGSTSGGSAVGHSQGAYTSLY